MLSSLTFDEARAMPEGTTFDLLLWDSRTRQRVRFVDKRLEVEIKEGDVCRWAQASFDYNKLVEAIFLLHSFVYRGHDNDSR